MNTHISSAVFSEQSKSETASTLLSDAFFTKFRSITKFYSLFHIIFWSVGFIQLLTILLFFSFFAQTTWAALAIASIFLTAFSYFVLRFYFQTKKREQFLQLKEELETHLSENVSIDKKTADYHIYMASVYIELASSLHEKEATYYTLPSSFTTLSPLLHKFSVWLHWKDVLKMKELLLFSSINETVVTVKMAPLDLKAHARLASCYLLLCQIYIDPRKAERSSSLRWISPEYGQVSMKEKFNAASDRAVEELTIIGEYAPNDLWTHIQLAKVYHDKELPQLEIRAYETLRSLKPEDENFLLRLGVLYFNEGMNSKGMKIYQELGKHSEVLAEELIGHYDSFEFHDLSSS